MSITTKAFLLKYRLESIENQKIYKKHRLRYLVKAAAASNAISKCLEKNKAVDGKTARQVQWKKDWNYKDSCKDDTVEVSGENKSQPLKHI